MRPETQMTPTCTRSRHETRTRGAAARERQAPRRDAPAGLARRREHAQEEQRKSDEPQADEAADDQDAVGRGFEVRWQD